VEISARELRAGTVVCKARARDYIGFSASAPVLPQSEFIMPELANLELTVEVEAASRGLEKESVAAIEEFWNAVRLALSAGATETARALACAGFQRHPADQGLAALARLLAPPRVLERELPPRPGTRANQEWLRAHSAEHGGSWVALRDGELVASARSLHELREAATASPDVFITRVV
jgi:hypothetical protein